MTRCRVCNCKLKSGDICPRCEREQEWLNTPEYFCTSSNCQKLLPGATEPGLCDACKKLAQIPYKPLKKPTKIENKPEAKPEIQEEPMLTQKSKETCKVCNHRLTKSGHCLSCQRRGNSNRARGKKSPAPKTGAEKTLCNETAQTVTQAPANVTHAYQEMPGIGEYCPEPAAATIHASQPPKVEGSEELPPPAADLPVSLRELQHLAHENAIKKGWHETPRSDGEMIALMHSELSEALEELRDGMLPGAIYHSDHNGFKPEGVPIELADVVIRIMDFCGLHGIDLQHAIVTKMVYNQTRPHRHGGKKL